MNTLSQTPGAASRVLQRTISLITGMGTAVVGGLTQLGAARMGSLEYAPSVDGAAASYASQVFAQALRDDSNLEMDWLWLATQVQREHERRYCLQRALEINPRSAIAREQLEKLPPIPAHIQRLTGNLNSM